jgi:RHS repeat-associated protein
MSKVVWELTGNWGRQVTVDYQNDGTPMASATPDVSWTYDAAGRVATRLDGAGTTTYTYTAWGQASKESLVTNMPDITSVTAEVERTFDGSNRLDLLKAKWGTAANMTAPQVDYNFSATTGLLDTVASGGRTVAISPVGGGAAWGTQTFSTGATVHLSATRTLDSAGRTGYVGYTASGVMLQSFDYLYDRDRVQQMTREKGSTADETAWLYGYDPKGQVLSADKKFSTNANATGTNFLAGYQTQYTYDEAGNRLSKGEGGSVTNVEGAGVRQTTYPQTNALNQYVQMRHPDSGGQKYDVLGRRSGSSEGITVNGATAVYQNNATTGLHFSSLQSVSAPPGTSYLTTNLGQYATFNATSSTAGVLDSGKVFLPHPYEAPAYDADGNLLSDSRWLYAWDAENRLTRVLSRHTPSVSLPAVDVTFGYDGLSRRIWKKTRTATDPAAYSNLASNTIWSTIGHEAYLYDGWNLVMRVILNNGNATARQSFVWGPDIGSIPSAHRSWQEAGGVGGLLMLLGDNSGLSAGHPGTADFAPLMDRMGNITALRRIQPQTAATVTNKALTSNVATLTVGSAAALYITGQTVTISGVDGTFNGTWTISAVTATSISYARTAANVASTAATGTATPGTALFAAYEYDAFGRELRNSGPAADWNPFRFSTKFTDDETGLVYYGYRYYHSGWGRWINRDPIGERGGKNLYCKVKNNTVDKQDLLGLHPLNRTPMVDSLPAGKNKSVHQFIKRCHVAIYVGHGSGEPMARVGGEVPIYDEHGKLKAKVQSESELPAMVYMEQDMGNAATAIGCFADVATEIQGAEISGYSRATTTLTHNQMVQEVISAYHAARHSVADLCTTNKCGCRSIWIYIIWGESADTQRVRAAAVKMLATSGHALRTSYGAGGSNYSIEKCP